MVGEHAVDSIASRNEADCFPTKSLVMLLALSVVVRLTAAVLVGSGFSFPDEIVYVDATRRLLNDGGYGAQYTGVPGYPLFLALLSLLHPISVTVLRASQATVAALGSV